MSLRLAFCAIVMLAVATIALAENGLERPHWQGHGIKAPDKNFPFEEIISGYWFRTKETQAIQDDDFNNPGFFAIEQGEQLWSQPDGAAGKSCASCHQEAAKSMKGVGAAMPKWSETQEAGQCRVANQHLSHGADAGRALEIWRCRNDRDDHLCALPVSRHAGESARRRTDDAVVRERQRALLHASRPARSRLSSMWLGAAPDFPSRRRRCGIERDL